MIIGITGSFGSGKTTVANIFGKHGFRVIIVDELYHGIYAKDKILRRKIRKEFGTLDRAKIKKIVFNDRKRLKKLNEITHPAIIEQIKKIISNSDKKIIIDAPLLFEAKMERLFDRIIVVKCNKKIQIKRLFNKKKYSKKEIENIIGSQMPLKEKIRKADFVVDNNGSLNDAKMQVASIASLMQKP